LYEFSGFVRAVFHRVTFTEQVGKDTQHIILEFCSTARSREEIMTFLGLKHREHFRAEIRAPLLKAGLLAPTIPDKPNSPKQKYIAVKSQGSE
jgi:ATP-dependent DNA helicase RecG